MHMATDTLLFTKDAEKARAEIEAAGGHVTHVFTPSVLVTALPDEVAATSFSAAETAPFEGLDEISQMAAEGWLGLDAEAGLESAVAGAETAEGIQWDTPGFQSPRSPHNDEELAAQASALEGASGLESTGTPTSLFMIGSIAVGLVVVSGTEASLRISNAEFKTVVKQVQKGLSFLAKAEPRAKITFVYDIRHLAVAVKPGTAGSYESREAPWRNAALQQMGFPGSIAGSTQYVKSLRAAKGTRWAYVAYFTKYPLHHFAYAVTERLCMEYSNDGWGPERINQLFAHETCHVFGAADEYGDCDCSGSGHLNIENRNCRHCTPNQEDCLMNANTLRLCQWSRGQLGWHDSLLPPK